MKSRYWILSPLAILTGCVSNATGPTTVQQGALITCGTETAAVNILADFKHAGKLSPAAIAVVNKDIAIVDPVCSSANPDVTIPGLAATAASELITLAGGQ